MSDNNWAEPVLFEEYPKLRDRIPWTRIGTFPTPVDECASLAGELGVARLFIKRDDLTNDVYGGNKVRKLEFLLPHAEKLGFKKLITLGGIGSNHLLATTIHGNSHGFDTIGVVMPQPVTPHVKKNMLLYVHFNTELHLAPGAAGVPGKILEAMMHNTLRGKPPYFVPGGGSSAVGATGYIEAAFELRRQVQQGDLPEPDYIFVATGSSGTAAGLTAGCRAAGLNCRVVSIKVADWFMANTFTLAQLGTFASARLRAADSGFPLQIFTPGDMEMRTEFFGGEYGVLTPEGAEAIELMKEHADLTLEGVYTGKAAAAMVAAARSGEIAGKNVLYWHTFNSVDLSDLAASHDYHELPQEFHKFFEIEEHTLEQ